MRKNLGWIGLFGLAGVVVGCGDGPRDENETSMMTGANNSASADDSGDGAAVDSSDEGLDDEGGTKLDVGDTPGSAEGGDPDDKAGCDKVDFLFIIDNSGSMGDEQQNLVSNFPGFIQAIQDTLDEAQDYHVMVLDSDDFVFAGCGLLCGDVATNGCVDQAGACSGAPECLFGCLAGAPCFEGGYGCGVSGPLECEDVLGAGIVHPRGTAASNQDCGFTSGARYLTADQPDLSGTFACAATVGTGSTLGAERPMEAMVQAVTPSTPAFACNEGFLRDDAILVVTFITDENDDAGDGSAGNVQGWRQALISAKNGDPNAVVVLGLFGDNDQPGGICPPLGENSTTGAEPSPRLREFVNSWGERGVAGSVCASSYQDFFLDAVSVIDTTCNDFVPPAG